jgi:hypothetical protein
MTNRGPTEALLFRAWLHRYGRQEWVIVQGATLEDAEATARKRYGHRLVSVKPILRRSAA